VASATITAATAGMFTTPAVEDRTSVLLAPNAIPAPVEKRIAVETVATAASATAGKDRWRDWLWGFLAVLCLSQFYFVRELVAAFALFVLAFGAIAAVVVGIYMLHKSWELVVARLAALRQPVLTVSRATHNTRKPA